MGKLFTHTKATYQNRKYTKKHKELEQKKINQTHAKRRNTIVLSTGNFLLLRQLNVGKQVLMGGSLLGLAASYFLSKKMSQSSLDSFKSELAKGQPYFESPKDVVDLRRTFFFVDDDKNYSPSLFYPGRNLDKLKPCGLIQLLYRQQL